MSTSAVDKGKQILTFDFRNPASSSSFNRFYTDLIPAGIYAGGRLTRLSDTVISIDRMVVIIHSNERDADRITVRIETTENQDLSLAASNGASSCNPAENYIVARFGWEDVESNFMDFLAVRYSGDPNEYRPNYIQPKDLVLGKIFYEQQNGNWIIKQEYSFDYSRRSRTFIPDEQLRYDAFRVQTCESSTDKIHVTGGSVATSKGLFNVVGGDYPVNGLLPTGEGKGRIDLVYIDTEGEIRIDYGQAAVNPAAPKYGSRRILAEIHRGADRTDILGEDIVPINPLGQFGTIEAVDVSITDESDYFIQKNIEAALKESWEKALALESLLDALTIFANNTESDLEDHVSDVVDNGIVHGIKIVDEIELD